MIKSMAAVLLFSLTVFPGYPESVQKLEKNIQSNQENLRKIQEKMAVLQKERSKLKKEEEDLFLKLKNVEKNIQGSTQKQNRLSRQIRQLESQIIQLNREVIHFSQEKNWAEERLLQSLKNYHARALVARRMRASPIQRWWLKDSIVSGVSQMKSAESLAIYSTAQREQKLGDKKELSSLKSHLNLEVSKQKKIQKEKSHLYQATLEKRTLMEQEVKRLQETRESLEKWISDLKRRKEETLAERKASEAAKKQILARKGNLPWPVEGTILSPYGKYKHPTLGLILIQNGIKIQAPPKSPVKSVEKGRVAYAADFRSYGQTVIIDHGGELYSIYGHLGEISVKNGKKVAGGEIIGLTNSNNGSQLYFEFRSQGKPENPTLWLTAKKETTK
ncbi:MAG: peptidoglycan DD-metalloendopeptidase family protein [Elusimicrobia bacterium]|nr:peptidoglycan DD-metalloendopeptidase family protein [Elusimicrobiota bacterium]